MPLDPCELEGRFISRTPLRGRFPQEKRISNKPGVLSFYRGDTIRLCLQVFDETETALDLTNVQSIISTWKDNECYLEDIFTFEVGSGITITDAVNGRLTIEMTADQSANLIPSTYVFDVEVTAEDGTVGTVIKRHVEISADVTEVYPPPEL